MSSTQATQIKVTLPNELFLYLKSKADKFGLPAASYIKTLVINDVKDMEIPVFKMSEKRERIALKALDDYEKGKTKELKNINAYLDNL